MHVCRSVEAGKVQAVGVAAIPDADGIPLRTLATENAIERTTACRRSGVGPEAGRVVIG